MHGIIYKISNKSGLQYFGSTISTLKKRLAKHKSKNNTCSSKNIINSGDYKCEVVLECYVNNKSELLKLEQLFIKYNNCINKQAAYLSLADKKKQTAEYYQKNREKIQEKKAEVLDCICGLTYTRSHKARHEKSQIHNSRI